MLDKICQNCVYNFNKKCFRKHADGTILKANKFNIECKYFSPSNKFLFQIKNNRE